MDGLFTIEDLPLIAFLACAFVFLLFSTIITWLLSKKFPTVWFFNKGLVAICLAVSVAIISGLFLNHYLSSLPSGVFAKVTGFYPQIEKQSIKF